MYIGSRSDYNFGGVAAVFRWTDALGQRRRNEGPRGINEATTIEALHRIVAQQALTSTQVLEAARSAVQAAAGATKAIGRLLASFESSFVYNQLFFEREHKKVLFAG